MQLFKRRTLLGLRASMLVILSLTLMVANHKYSRMVDLRNNAALFISPLQYIVSAPVRMVSWISTNVTSQRELISQNDQLRARELMLLGKLQRFMAVEQENRNLRKLLRSSPHAGEKFLAAQLVAVDTDPFAQQVMINKGKRDNVYEGQPVLDAYGVMGQVIAVGPRTATVMLVTDSRSAIPVMNDRNNRRGIAIGTGYSDRLRLLHVPEAAGIRVGDLIVTSGLGQRYPSGYPLGIVTKIRHQGGDPFLVITLEPSAHIDRSRQVLLVWPSRKEFSYHGLLNQFVHQKQSMNNQPGVNIG